MLLYMCNCQRSKQKRDVDCAFSVQFKIIHARIKQVPQTHPNYNCQKQTFCTNHDFFIVCKLHKNKTLLFAQHTNFILLCSLLCSLLCILLFSLLCRFRYIVLCRFLYSFMFSCTCKDLSCKHIVN